MKTLKSDNKRDRESRKVCFYLRRSSLQVQDNSRQARVSMWSPQQHSGQQLPTEPREGGVIQG
ncbi:hypothetical protein JOB18_023866 [Solea senegalensis]|uniref:Uncharacterized protein n=1 Tax=Solea senegalensis TaxID=28829 RepID=A0AAV6QC00_SOLSE|nr:hypothetical protein JOB18_023866 [Solea senegalensis]